MGVNELRIVIMIVSVAVFLGILCWTYSPKRRANMRDAGAYILDDDELMHKGEQR